MSSDGYFDDYDDELDKAALDELDAIEAAAYAVTSQTPNAISGSTTKASSSPVKQSSLVQPLKPPQKEDSFCDLTLDLDEDDLERLDDFIADSYAGKVKPVTGPTRQTTLFGDVLPNDHETNGTSSRAGLQRTTSSSRNPFGQRPEKTKVWDHTAFAKSGQKRKQRAKGKAGEECDGEEEIEFEQFPAPFVSIGPPPSMKLKPDLLEAKHWIFPLNQPKRDYQYNIVKNSLFENTIISVPTGLGKTFIAGVVMLNYYRWFPEGKVVFVAPTKPLVAQQVKACHKTCGIPGDDAAEMTGEVPRVKRERQWREKRVFYMTPQTFMNDLATQNCDVMDIVLIVVDEAHKATGGYAYNQIVRYMMAKNPHFRLIALTATPGSNPLAVQNLVDGLHISHIEIRDENSLDLRPYLHEKKVESHCIVMTEEIHKIKDLLAKLMDTYLKPLKANGILYPNADPVTMHPYTARGKLSLLPPNQRGMSGYLMALGNLAQAMGFLLEGTIKMAYSFLKFASEKDLDDNASASNKAQSKRLRENELFKKLMVAFEACKTMSPSGFPSHPKMDKTVNLLVDYYSQRLPDSDNEDGDEDSSGSKAMVFVTHREAVDEIVEALNAHRPMIRASRFIGQGTDKHGNRGQAQKEQLEIIQKFQDGEFNVLVATCIGEEGLDIGEVDLIICYDTQKTPIRMLQRFGRTGRKRAGCVHVLLAEGREEFNLDKARAQYKEVQKTICRGDDLEFFGDVERLLPNHVKPACLEKVMEIKPYVREERRTKGSPTRPAAKRKRDNNPMRNIPEGAHSGFVSVKDLIIKGNKKRKVIEPRSIEEAGEDDDIDKELEAGIVPALYGRRTQSMADPASSSKLRSGSDDEKPKPKGRLKKAATIATESSSARPKGKKKALTGTSEGKGRKKQKRMETAPPFSQQGRDDSVDRELENDLYDAPPLSPIARRPGSASILSPPEKPSEQTSFKTSVEDDAMELTDNASDRGCSQTPFTQAGSRIQDSVVEESMAWLVEDDEDEAQDIVILSSSPVISKIAADYDQSIEIVEATTYGSKSQGSLSFTAKSRAPMRSHPNLKNEDILELSSEPDPLPDKSISMSPETKARKVMPPPSLPRPNKAGPSSSPHVPDNTQPIRRCGQNQTRQYVPLYDQSSDLDVDAIPPPSQRRLRRRGESTSAPPRSTPKKEKKGKKPLLRRKHNPLLDYTAEHSGDEVSEGSSHSDDEVESDSDRLFIKDSPITQPSPSYDQTQAYRRSLMTQVPGAYGTNGPVFARGPVRSRPFGRLEPRVRRRVVDSSPPPEDDEYEFGSFVVDNDAEISYLTQVETSF